MSSSVQMDVNDLANKCALLGLIDLTYQIEALYRQGDLLQGEFILNSLRDSLKELSASSKSGFNEK